MMPACLEIFLVQVYVGVRFVVLTPSEKNGR